MSHVDPAEPRVQDIINAARGPIKCRIPQRLPSARQKPSAYKPKIAVNSKSVVVSAQQPRFAARSSSRPRSGEQTRPKSANRAKEDVTPPKHAFAVPRPARLGDKERLPFPRGIKTSTIPKRIMNEHNMVPNKTSRPVIMVPVTQKQPSKTMYTNRTMTCLPDQETINRHEDLEMQQGDQESPTSPCTDFNDRESITSRSEKVTQLKITWQEKIILFEKMKNELNDRQKAIMELYATLGVTQQKMFALGQRTSLPPADELRIMNVANMKPDQLLQLCANARQAQEKQQDGANTPIAIDMSKLYNMPSKLVATCEQTLVKRKEIIETLESMTTKEGISLSQLLKRIKEFSAENEMLTCSLEKAKNEFYGELNDIVDVMRKYVKDIMAAQLNNENLTYAMSELNAQKDDLRKQIHNADHLKSSVNKTKLEELEKQLKEEKCKRTLLRDRLARAEGQVNVSVDHASQLEAALEQSRSKCWNLERTVQQLREQNQKLQNDFDRELKKFTESIRENTAHLEEIADARDKLQTEKEELEMRLNELSTNYSESLKQVKHEMNNNIMKLIEIEKRYKDLSDDKLKLEEKVESLCSQLLESELRYKDTYKQLQERELQLSKTVECYRDLEGAKTELSIANKELDSYRNRLSQQSDAVKDIERNFKEALKLEDDLRCELRSKNEYITELEKKHVLLEKQLHESQSKMTSYEEQLTVLKTHFAQLQEDFGVFENINELKELINQQRAKLLETTRQNGELAEALQKKDLELVHHIENAAEQDQIIEQRDGIIKMLSDKEEEHANIIKLLRNNLEMRTQADIDLNQQLSEKNIEIESLMTNLEKRKQQIDQLEKIILTLEEQTHKASAQKRKDHDKIMILESKIAEYESYRLEHKSSREAPAENLDNIIKILEDELGTTLDPRALHIQPSYHHHSKKRHVGDRIQDTEQKLYDIRDGNNRLPMYEDYERRPTKFAMDNYSKKMYDDYKGENLDRKKANTSIDTQKYVSIPNAGLNVYDAPPAVPEKVVPRGRAQSRPKDIFLTRNLNFISPVQFREDKKCKMYKLAGHKL